MKRAAIFFDRDNTLIANDGYLGDPNGVLLVHGAADAIARARAMGYAIVVFSNQSGVARGLFTEEAVHAVNHRLDEMLLDENPHAVIDRHEFCPYLRDAEVEAYRQDSDLRKPKPGMIFQAERQLALDLSRSWVVGDAPRDIDAGKAAGCKTILVTNPTLTASQAALQISENRADFEVRTLAEAMEVVARDVITHSTSAVANAEPAAIESAAPVARMEEGTTKREPVVVVENSEEDMVEPNEPEKSDEAIPREPDPVVESAIPMSVPGPEVEFAALEAESVSPAIAAMETKPAGHKAAKSRSDILLAKILDELQRTNEQPSSDFSVSKLMAGVVQVMAIAMAILSYLKNDKPADFGTPLLLILAAIFLQAFTISLLIMGRQK